MKKHSNKSLIAGAILAAISSQAASATEFDPILTTNDTYVNTHPNNDWTNVRGNDNYLNIERDWAGVIQFLVPEIPEGEVVTQAILRMKVNGNQPIPNTFIASVENYALEWDEQTLIQSQHPFGTVTKIPDASIGTGEGDASTWVLQPETTHDFNITAAINGAGLHTFFVDGDSDIRSQQRWLAGRFENNEPGRAQLIITTGAGDTISPVFDVNEIPAININASGQFTDISASIAAANITATDETDVDPIVATIVGNADLASGVHTVTLQAQDAAGNTTTKDVTVNITPLLTLSADQSALAGTSIPVLIGLSGPAVSYPVSISYNLTGDAVTNSSDTLTFNENNYADPQAIDVLILENAETDQTGELSLTNEVNALLPLTNLSTITAVNGNIKPDVTLTFEQNGAELHTITTENADIIYYIDGTAGDVTVTANIMDPNVSDSHSISWSGSSEGLIAAGNSFNFSAESLSGDFNLVITATEDNTEDLFSASLMTTFRVQASSLPTLTEVDSDGDSIPDVQEGYLDSDGDGIVDYLDNNSDTTELPLADEQAPLKTLEGLTLALGSIGSSALGIDAKSALISFDNLSNSVPAGSEDTVDTGYFALEGVSLINFKITGVNAGGKAPIVYSLPDDVFITESTEYRKYTPSAGWTEFVNEGENSIASAMKVSDNCPAPNDPSYTDGLIGGNNCIQLTLVDGGIYDADGSENGSIEDPGVLAELKSAPLWDNTTTTLEEALVNEGDDAVKTVIDLKTQASDADGDALTFAKVSDIAAATIDENGILTIDYSGLSGDYTVVVSVSDGDFSPVEKTINFSANANASPKLSPLTLPNASRNVSYKASIAEQASATDGESYTISKVSGSFWLKVSDTGELSGTPRNVDIGENVFEIQISDDRGAMSTTTYTIMVEDSTVRESKGGSFSIALFAFLSLFSLRRRKL